MPYTGTPLSTHIITCDGSKPGIHSKQESLLSFYRWEHGAWRTEVIWPRWYTETQTQDFRLCWDLVFHRGVGGVGTQRGQIGSIGLLAVWGGLACCLGTCLASRPRDLSEREEISGCGGRGECEEKRQKKQRTGNLCSWNPVQTVLSAVARASHFISLSRVYCVEQGIGANDSQSLWALKC